MEQQSQNLISWYYDSDSESNDFFLIVCNLQVLTRVLDMNGRFGEELYSLYTFTKITVEAALQLLKVG